MNQEQETINREGEEVKGQIKEQTKEQTKEQGRYIYCVAEGPKSIFSFGNIGIEGSEVYFLSTGVLCAVVHDCKAEPYKSDDENKVKEWVKTHQKVIDLAARKLGTVIPSSFDVIIKGDNPNSEVLRWLKEEEENLKNKLNKITGKQEFGIQICFDKECLAEEIVKKNKQIQKLQKEMNRLSKGKAYFHEQKIKELVKTETEKKATFYFKRFYGEIREHTNHVKVEKPKEENMLLNISCLLEKEKVKELGTALDKINKAPFSVKFTGPWPAYSFVS